MNLAEFFGNLFSSVGGGISNFFGGVSSFLGLGTSQSCGATFRATGYGVGDTSTPPQQPLQPPAAQPIAPPKNACAPSGTAPAPSVYQQRGQTANGMLNSNDPYGMGPAASLFYNASELYQFKRGNALDAQVRYGGSPAYANYVFGVYLGAVGWTLPQTLAAANDYARTRSSYSNHPPMDPNYPATPAANVANITAGYNAQQNGTLCHK